MRYRGFILALASAALFALATPLSKLLLRDLPPNLLAGLLYLGAAGALLPLVLRRRSQGQTIFPHDRLNRRRLLGAVLFGGVIGPVLLLVGLKHALAASVSMWLNLETVATAVLAWLLFREHMGRWTWLGNLGVLSAGLLLGFGSDWAGWIGLACVAGAAIAWGLDNNFTALIDGISPEDSTFWKGLIAGATNLLIGLALTGGQVGGEWLWALGLGAISYGASIALYIRAAQCLGATRSQMVFASSPFFGVLLSVLWLGEGLSALQIVAAAMLAGSIGLLFLDRHEHVHQHEPLTHEHEHRHDDAHHAHEHPGLSVDARHCHVHTHAAITHAHPHWPDLHHRHHGR